MPSDNLLVPKERYARSVHATRGCAECHFDYDRHPHPRDAETAKCVDCHEDAAKALGASVHGKAADGKPVDCAACHGVHDVLKPSDRESRLHPLNVHGACGKCHFSIDPASATVDQLMREPYTDDAHSHGLFRAGLAASATFDRAGPAVGLTLAYVMVNYFFEILGSLWTDVDWTQEYSLFHHFNATEILGGQLDPIDLVVTGIAFVVPIVWALVVFPRRDLAAPA